MLGIADADSAEHGSGSRNLVIAPAACRRDGRQAVRLLQGTRLAGIYGSEQAEEEYRCNYDVNPEYRALFQPAGLVEAAVGENGELRAVELPDHRFFIATLFLPQHSSSEERPHPLVMAYCGAALLGRAGSPGPAASS